MMRDENNLTTRAISMSMIEVGSTLQKEKADRTSLLANQRFRGDRQALVISRCHLLWSRKDANGRHRDENEETAFLSMISRLK